MSKPLKIAAIAAAGLIAVVAVVLAVIVATFDPNDYKDRITQAVAEQTGRTLSIPGDISLSIFPWIGVETGKVMLSNAGGFGEAPFVEFDSAEVKVKLIPLISRNIEVSTVNVSGLNLNLARNESGVTNWDDLLQAENKQPETTTTPESAPAGGGTPAIGSLTVGGVNIANANLVWDDRMQNVRYAVSDLNVSTGRLTPGRPADITLSTSVASSEPEIMGSIKISTTVHLGDNMDTGSLKNLQLTTDLTGDGLPGGKLKATVSGDAELDMRQKIATVSNLKAGAFGVNLAGNARVVSFDTEPTADISLSLAQFNPKKVMQDLGLAPIKTNDPNALTSVAGSIDGRFTTTTADISNLDMQIDGTTLSGSAKARDFTKPDLSFDLKAGSLDMDRYMPPKAEETGEQQAEKTDKEKKKDEGILTQEQREQLRRMVIDGKLAVGEFKVWKMTLNDVNLNIKAKDGVFNIDPLNMNLYGGDYKSSLKADFSGERMGTALNLNLADMQLGSLLTDLMGSDKVTGLARLRLNITSMGESLWPFLRNLDGSGSAGLRDGAFKGFQVVPEPVQKQVNAQDEAPKIEEVTKQQSFKTLTTDFNIDDGVLKTKALELAAEGLAATGDGSIDLAEQTIDYQAVIDMSAFPLIPFNITGPLADPSYSLDTPQFLINTAKGIVNIPLKTGKGAIELGGDALKGGAGAVESLGDAIGGGGKKEEQPAN